MWLPLCRAHCKALVGSFICRGAGKTTGLPWQSLQRASGAQAASPHAQHTRAEGCTALNYATGPKSSLLQVHCFYQSWTGSKLLSSPFPAKCITCASSEFKEPLHLCKPHWHCTGKPDAIQTRAHATSAPQSSRVEKQCPGLPQHPNLLQHPPLLQRGLSSSGRGKPGTLLTAKNPAASLLPAGRVGPQAGSRVLGAAVLSPAPTLAPLRTPGVGPEAPDAAHT